MGKSSKKSTKVDSVAAVTPLPTKGKRGAEEAIAKVSLKKLKKNDGKAQAIEKLKSETKTQKKNIKKEESSSSEDESSDSEEEQKVVKSVTPSTKKPAVNGTAKKEKSSSSDSSSDDSDSEEVAKPKAKVIAPSAKKMESSSDSDSSDDSDSEKEVKPKGKVIAPSAKKTESSSDDSSSDSDDDAPKPIQGKKVAPKADTSSDDSSSEEENDKKSTAAVNKSAAATKNQDDSSSDEEDDSSSEDEKPKVAKAPVTSKATESTDSSDDSDSDSEDDTTPAKKPASSGKNTKQDVKKESSDEESDEEDTSEDEDEDEDEKPSKGQKKNEDVEMVDAVTPKPAKKAPETPVTPQVQSGESKTLFVGNLPFSVEQSHIEDFFKDAGKIAEVRFSSDREGVFRGYGHVEFETAEAAQKALALNGKELMGRELRLDLARERGAYTPGTERTPFQKTSSSDGTTMFVGGIDRNSAEDEVRSALENHFATCGVITRVSIPTDRESGEMRGIAYVDFADRGSLNKALELGGPEFGGYTLKVDEAKPRDNSGSNSRGGRDGGGRFQRGRRDNNSGGRFDRNSGGRGDRSFGRSGGGGRSGGRRGGFNKPSLAAPGTGKKTTFDD